MLTRTSRTGRDCPQATIAGGADLRVVHTDALAPRVAAAHDTLWGMDSTPKLRLSGPGSLVAAVPHLLGFPPEESLVLVGLRGPRSRLGITMRLDLPSDGPDYAPAAEELHSLGKALRDDGSQDCLAMIMTEQADDDGVAPYVDLVSNLDQALYECGIDASDIVLVRSGTWRSYLCPDPTCCPVELTGRRR